MSLTTSWLYIRHLFVTLSLVSLQHQNVNALKLWILFLNSPTCTQGQEIILKIVADYRIMGSRALCFLTSFPPSSKDSMECSKLLTGAVFPSHGGGNSEPGTFSVLLRPQSQLVAGAPGSVSDMLSTLTNHQGAFTQGLVLYSYASNRTFVCV